MVRIVVDDTPSVAVNDGDSRKAFPILFHKMGNRFLYFGVSR
jgi:hypothetical protein